MRSSEKWILVIDPAIRRPEIDAYNYLLSALELVNQRDAGQKQGLRFWLPHLGDHSNLESYLKVHSELLGRLSGCISLGSYAHVTERDKYPWIPDFERLIDLVIGQQIPFLGICFAHQYLALKQGLKVDYCRDESLPGATKYNVELRSLEIVSPRLRALCAQVSEDEWRRHSPRAFFLRRALRAIRSGFIRDRNMAKPMGVHERDLEQVLKFAPQTLRAWSRHEQMVYGAALDEAPQRYLYKKSLRAPGFEYDGLIHEHLPVFTFQTHPERPHTLESDHFIKNFMTLCGLSTELDVVF